MDTNDSTVTATAKPTSRLAQMQLRYQQRQQIERDQKKSELTNASSPASNARSLAAIELGDSMRLTGTLGAGKVRQMFDERRQKTAGIDKSYPLQPLAANVRKSPMIAGRTRVTAATVTTTTVTSINNGNGGGGDSGAGDYTNGNYTLASSHITSADFLDNEQFPDETLMDDDIDHRGGGGGRHSATTAQTTIDNNGNNMSALKLPTVRKQLSNLSIKARQQPVGRLVPVAKTTFTRTVVVPSNTAPAARRGVIASRNGAPAAAAAAAAGVRKLEPMKKVAAAAPVGLVRKAPSTLTSNRLAAAAQSPPREVSTDAVDTPKSTNSMASTRSSRQSSASNSAVATPKQTPRPANDTNANTTAAPPPNFGPPPDNMAACRICGRHFNNDRLEKHETICQKTAAKKRKIFDATKHRLAGTDAETFVKKALRSQRIAVPAKGAGVSAAAIAKLTATTTPPPKRSDWRRKHEEFIAAIRSAKQVQVHLAKGGKLSDLPPPPPSENPDYVQCPHCERRFNASAAERHIPKCASFQHNKPKPATRTMRKF